MRNLGTIIVDKDIITKDYINIDSINFLSGYSTCSDISSIPISKHRCIVTLNNPDSSLTYTLGLNLPNNQDLSLGDTILVTVSVSGIDSLQTDITATIAIPSTINNKKVFFNGTYAPQENPSQLSTIVIGSKNYEGENQTTYQVQSTLMLIIARDPAGYHISNLNTGFYFY